MKHPNSKTLSFISAKRLSVQVRVKKDNSYPRRNNFKLSFMGEVFERNFWEESSLVWIPDSLDTLSFSNDILWSVLNLVSPCFPVTLGSEELASDTAEQVLSRIPSLSVFSVILWDTPATSCSWNDRPSNSDIKLETGDMRHSDPSCSCFLSPMILLLDTGLQNPFLLAAAPFS